MEKETKEVLEKYKEHTDKKIEEVKRHFDICKEDFDGKVVLIGEQYGSIQEKLTEHDKNFQKIDKNFQRIDKKFQRIDKNFQRINGTLEIVKNDIELIKYSLKKKVDIEDFEALESRVRTLESKIKL